MPAPGSTLALQLLIPWPFILLLPVVPCPKQELPDKGFNA
jgi:hypothetical protein